jgi:hypothetical protein
VVWVLASAVTGEPVFSAEPASITLTSGFRQTFFTTIHLLFAFNAFIAVPLPWISQMRVA